MFYNWTVFTLFSVYFCFFMIFFLYWLWRWIRVMMRAACFFLWRTVNQWSWNLNQLELRRTRLVGIMKNKNMIRARERKRGGHPLKPNGQHNCQPTSYSCVILPSEFEWVKLWFGTSNHSLLPRTGRKSTIAQYSRGFYLFLRKYITGRN